MTVHYCQWWQPKTILFHQHLLREILEEVSCLHRLRWSSIPSLSTSSSENSGSLSTSEGGGDGLRSSLQLNFTMEVVQKESKITSIIIISISNLKNRENTSQASVRCGDTQHPTLVALKLAFQNVKVPRCFSPISDQLFLAKPFSIEPFYPDHLIGPFQSMFLPKSLKMFYYHQIKI